MTGSYYLNYCSLHQFFLYDSVFPTKALLSEPRTHNLELLSYPTVSHSRNGTQGSRD